MPPSRDAYDLCFKHKMLAKKKSSLSDDFFIVDDEDDVDIEVEIIYASFHITQVRAQRECK